MQISTASGENTCPVFALKGDTSFYIDAVLSGNIYGVVALFFRVMATSTIMT